MKKFSTAARHLVLVSLFGPLVALAALPDNETNQETDKQTVSTMHCEFLPDAPDQHEVVRGDTLWGISGKFLQHPWCWPQVWGINREQIRDPHWIYPGQIVYFDRVAGRLRLGNPAGSSVTSAEPQGNSNSPTVHLIPQQRMQGLGRDAIPAISAAAIEPFLSQPLIVEEKELMSAPRIVAAQEGRVYLGKGDTAYVMGNLGDATVFQTFRPGQPLKDPETNRIIGYEAVYLGVIKLDHASASKDEAHRFKVLSSKEEMGVGDRMVPEKPTTFLNYMPHAPESKVAARIVSVYGGVTQAGQNQVVTVNRGKQDGLDLGAVLQLYRHGDTIVDRTNGTTAVVKLPDEQYGSLFIFRVFNKISYGLVMQVTDSVQVGDVARSPE